MQDVETIVVGGGPAGASCAGELHRRGREVLVLDKAAFPRDKPCAGWISREVWELLHTDPALYPHPVSWIPSIEIHGKRFHLTLPVSLQAIRRVEFDQWILSQSGISVLPHRVETIRIEGEWFILDERFRCRFLVGAGGTACPVARALFRKEAPRLTSSLIVAFAEEFPLFPITYAASPHPSTSITEPCRIWPLFRGLPGYAWYVPKAGGWVNIGLGGKAFRVRREGNSLIGYWKLFLEHLSGKGMLDPRFLSEKKVWEHPRGHGYYLWEGKRILQRGNAFVIGDAAGLATADMGEGIANAIGSGILVAEAIALGTPIRPESVRSELHRYSEPWPVNRILSILYQ